MSPPISTKPRLRPEHRRTLLEREALRLFGRQGYAATRLDDVAAAAGVTKPMVYRHFASKKDLYLALLRRHEADLPTFIEDAALPVDADPSTVIDTILDGWLDYVEENSDSWLILFRDKTGDRDIERARVRVSRRANEVMSHLVRELAPHLDHELVEPTADFLTSGLAGLVLWWIDHPEVPKDRVKRTAMRVTTATLRE